MTAEGHLLFSVACAIFAKKAELTPALALGDWWQIVPASLLTALLPDIDHPRSTLGQRLSWISRPIAHVFGHRGFTHSLLAIIVAVLLFLFKAPESWVIPTAVFHGLILGYLSHLLADMLTPMGVPLFWPYRWRFRIPILRPQSGNQLERFLCIGLIIWGIYWTPPYSLPELFEQIKHKL